MKEECKNPSLDVAADILQIVRDRQQLKEAAQSAKSRDKTSANRNTKMSSREATIIMEKEMTTEDYLYDLKLRKYIRDIQLCNRLLKKKGLLRNESDKENNNLTLDAKEMNLAEKIEEYRINGNSVPGSRQDARKESKDTPVKDRVRLAKTKRNVSTQTKISCLNPDSNFTSVHSSVVGWDIIPRHLVEEYTDRLQDQNIEGDNFILELHEFRKQLHTVININSDSEIRQPEPDIKASVDDKSTNTEIDDLFKPLCDIDIYSDLQNRKSDAKSKRRTSNSSDDYLTYLKELFEKQNQVLPRTQSRWPKGHKHHTIPAPNILSQFIFQEKEETKSLFDGRYSRNGYPTRGLANQVRRSVTFHRGDTKCMDYRKRKYIKRDDWSKGRLAREKLLWRAYIYTDSSNERDEYYFQMWLKRLKPKLKKL